MSHATVASLTKSISLYFSDGRSDKEYHVQLEEKEPGYVVNFQYGRRGSTLQAGTKTACPVSYAQAVKIYDKLVSEKTAKGYSPGEEGIAYQQTDFADRATGIVPQLLNPVEESDLEFYMENDDFVLQQKYDGERRLLKHMCTSIVGINRRGLKVALPESLTLIPQFTEGFVMDGEQVGENYFVFDLLELGNEDLTPLEYWDRYARLKRLVEKIALPNILLVTSFEGYNEKVAALNRYKTSGVEGIVFKSLSAPYSPGRPASGGRQLKFKFTSSASVFVRGINPGKRSVSIAVYEGNRIIDIGNVAIPANHDVPCEGEVVEIRYLYAYPQGALYQPFYLGKRNDLEKRECTIGQLKFKNFSNDSEE